MATSKELRAGVARANITPPVGIDLCGFAGRGNSQGLLDDLYATALVLDDGTTRAAIVALDLIFLDQPYVERVTQRAEKQAKVPAGNILLCCSHTHYGPQTSGFDKDAESADEGAYMADLKFKLAGVITEARRGLQPATLAVGRTECAIGINRRERMPDGRIILGNNPTGAIDRELTAVRIDSAKGDPMACLVGFACHAVSQGSQARLISTDFVGPARALFEGSTGAMMMFLQGACGNINSLELTNDPEVPRRLGSLLGAAALEAHIQAEEAGATPLRCASEVAHLPAKAFECVDEGKDRVASLAAELERLRTSAASKGAIHWAELRLKRAEAMLEAVSSGKPLPTVDGVLHAVRIGDVAIATAPGEIFCEIGLAVKEGSPHPHTLFAGYTNGSIGYVPVPEAYPEGGYEVTHASRVASGAAQVVTEGALRLLKRTKRAR